MKITGRAKETAFTVIMSHNLSYDFKFHLWLNPQGTPIEMAHSHFKYSQSPTKASCQIPLAECYRHTNSP